MHACWCFAVCPLCVWPKPTLPSGMGVPELALLMASFSSAALALLMALAVSMHFVGTIPGDGTIQAALYSPPTVLKYIVANRCWGRQLIHVVSCVICKKKKTGLFQHTAAA